MNSLGCNMMRKLFSSFFKEDNPNEYRNEDRSENVCYVRMKSLLHSRFDADYASSDASWSKADFLNNLL
jgi:hypothetical protein